MAVDRRLGKDGPGNDRRLRGGGHRIDQNPLSVGMTDLVVGERTDSDLVGQSQPSASTYTRAQPVSTTCNSCPNAASAGRESGMESR